MRSTGLALALLLAGCASHPAVRSQPTATPAPTPTATLAPQDVPTTAPPALWPRNNARPLADGTCAQAQLAARFSAGVDPMTGEHGTWLTVLNVSHRSCRVATTLPAARAYAGSHLLPFRVYHHGMYVDAPNGSGTQPVHHGVLAAGAGVHLIVAKYRCDTGGIANATTLQLKVARDGWTTVALPAEPGVAVLTYCDAYNGAPDSTDPGNRLEVGALLRGALPT